MSGTIVTRRNERILFVFFICTERSCIGKEPIPLASDVHKLTQPALFPFAVGELGISILGQSLEKE